MSCYVWLVGGDEYDLMVNLNKNNTTNIDELNGFTLKLNWTFSFLITLLSSVYEM